MIVVTIVVISRSLLPSAMTSRPPPPSPRLRAIYHNESFKFATRRRGNTQGEGGSRGRNIEKGGTKTNRFKRERRRKRRGNSLTRVNHDDTTTRRFARDPPPEVFSSPPVRRFPSCHSAPHSPPTFTEERLAYLVASSCTVGEDFLRKTG